MSKLPVREIHEKDALSPITKALLALIAGLLPAMTAIVGGLFAVFTYLDHQDEAQRLIAIQLEKDRVSRLAQASQPYAKKQLDLFSETGRLLGKIISYGPTTQEYTDSRRRLKEIQHGEMMLIGGSKFVTEMENMESQLTQYEANPDDAQRKLISARAEGIGEAMRSELLYLWSWRGEEKEAKPTSPKATK
jgi:hypothetical protein